MRVATYTQRTAATRGSIYALGVLVLTLLMGTGMVPTLAAYIGGPLESVLTPMWLLLYLLSVAGLMFTQGINWISWLVRYRILLVILILGTMVSVSWSIDARVSTERTVHLVGSTLIAIFIGFSVPLLTTLRVFAVVLSVAILASIGAAVALPDLGIQSYEGSLVWRGVFNSKNDLGFWAAAGVLLYITLSDSTRTTWLKLLCFLMSGLCLVALAFSQSATSLLALIIASMVCLYFFIAGRFQLGFIRMVMLAVLFTGVIGMAIANIDTAELVGRSGDLTGRGEVWRQVWKLILERPLTGVGYGSLWFPTDDTIWIQQSLTDFTWIVYHAHNGLLQIASEVGMPLAVIALLMVAQQLIEIFYCQYERQQVGVLFVLGFVIAYLVSNYSEARFLVTRELFWIFFVALPVSMLRQINLVSEDSGEMDDEDPYPASSAGFAARAAHPVPGKPWLAQGTGQRAGARAAAATSSGMALMTHDKADPKSARAGDHDRSVITAESREYSEHDATNTDTLSLDETDIDLGELEDTEDLSQVGAQTDIDLGKPEDEIAHLPGSTSTTKPSRAGTPSEPCQEDDLLGVDRYDKKIDLPDDDWADLHDALDDAMDEQAADRQRGETDESADDDYDPRHKP